LELRRQEMEMERIQVLEPFRSEFECTQYHLLEKDSGLSAFIGKVEILSPASK
jgi:hypothetical protein